MISNECWYVSVVKWRGLFFISSCFHTLNKFYPLPWNLGNLNDREAEVVESLSTRRVDICGIQGHGFKDTYMSALLRERTAILLCTTCWDEYFFTIICRVRKPSAYPTQIAKIMGPTWGPCLPYGIRANRDADIVNLYKWKGSWGLWVSPTNENSK